MKNLTILSITTLLISFASHADSNLQKLKQELPCPDGANHQVKELEATGKIKINVGAEHFGQTLTNDILRISNLNGKESITVYYCPVPKSMKLKAFDFSMQPILNNSFYCSVSEISAADIMIKTNIENESYNKAFFPIGLAQTSSLCSPGSSFGLDVDDSWKDAQKEFEESRSEAIEDETSEAIQE